MRLELKSFQESEHPTFEVGRFRRNGSIVQVTHNQAVHSFHVHWLISYESGSIGVVQIDVLELYRSIIIEIQHATNLGVSEVEANIPDIRRLAPAREMHGLE